MFDGHFSLLNHVLPENKWVSRLHGLVCEQDEVHTSVTDSHLICIRLPCSNHIALFVLHGLEEIAEKTSSGERIHVKARLGAAVHARLGSDVKVEDGLAEGYR